MVKLPVKPLQFLKAPMPIYVTELGMVNEPVKPLQLLNAPLAIVVTELPIVKDVKFLQSAKAA